MTSSDYGNEVHVASGEDEVGVGVGITSDDVVQLLARDGSSMSPSRSQSRVPIDQSRWSEGYRRSRPSSFGHPISPHENGIPKLHHKPSFDVGWQTVDERDEADLLSDDVSDDEQELDDHDGHNDLDLRDNDDDDDDDNNDDDDNDDDECTTAAVVIVEEGRGLIVRGDGVPLVQLQVQPGM